MKFVKLFIVSLLFLFISGCPSKIYQIESLYFSDRYIDSIIEAGKLTSKPKEIAYLSTFLDQNGIQLRKQLLIRLNEINEFPTKEELKKLDPLIEALKTLNTTFPNQITLEFIDTVAEKNQEIKEFFVIFTKSSLLYLLPRGKYRQAYDALTDIKAQTLLTPADKRMYQDLSDYLPRTLHINKIRVHDSSIKKLIKKKKKKKPSNYYSLGSTLLEDAINVPKEFNRHLTHYIKKEKSEFLTLTDKTPSSSYLLNCSVNIKYNKELLEKRQEITNIFYVKYEPDQEWQQIPLTYEIFVQSKTYKAIVDADAYITKGTKLIGRFTFETIRNYDSIRVGEFMNDMSNFADIMHAQEYKDYLKPNNENSKDYFIKGVLQDAAEVLSVKVLSTIDTDPDPYSAAFPLEF